MNYSTISLQTMQRFFAVFAILAMVFGPFANIPFAQAVRAAELPTGVLDANTQVDLCHKNEGASGYSLVQTKAVNIVDAEPNGHPAALSIHADDIIPPFEYNFGAGTTTFDGRNWDSDIFDNNCNIINLDVDNDGVIGLADNCPLISNPAQDDGDEDGIGDACEIPTCPEGYIWIGSCIPFSIPIPGCMDPAATNYNPAATINMDIFCVYDEDTESNEVVIVSEDTAAGENQEGWLFNRDSSTATPFEFNEAQASIGDGSLNILPIGSNPSDKFIAEYFLLTPIADVKEISYDFMIGAGGEVSDENEFYMNVYANFGESSPTKFYDCRYNIVPTVGSTGAFTTVTFDPTLDYPVATRGGAEASPHTCPASPADMDTLSTGSSTIRVFALNVGDTGETFEDSGIGQDQGLDGYLDKAVIVIDQGANVHTTTFDFEPAPTSEITLCKIDQDNNELSGWNLMLKGAFVEDLQVPVNTPVGVDSLSLTADKSYIAVASGTWLNDREPDNLVDAEYSTEDNWVTQMDGFTGYTTDILELSIDSILDPLSNWGPYNSLHTYAQSFIPALDGNVTFSINDSNHADNSGSLNVSLFEGYAGVTGENGCVTIEDVPYGTYEIDEIDQEGWRNLEGLVSVVVDTEEETFTVENTDQEPKVATLEITNPAVDGTELVAAPFTFEAEYNDDDNTIDKILWAIRANTCAASTGTVAGNVDGFTDVSSFVGNLFSTLVDMTGWADGDYCFVVNPQEQNGEDDLRETRLFTLETPEVVTYAPYCGDQIVNQGWEQCELGTEGCTDYCMFDNQCHNVQLAKITLDQTASVSFDGSIYLGSDTNIIPSGAWFNLEEVGDALVNLTADAVDGLAVERDHNDDTLKLAFRGGNDRKDLDIVSGEIDLLGARTIPVSIMRSVMATSYKLEPEDGTGGFPDLFDADGNAHIDFDMRTDTGNDGVTMPILADEEYGQCIPDDENPGDGDGDEEKTYRVFGNVWNDENEDDERNFVEDESDENDEPILNGWLITATMGDQIATTTTDQFGGYELNLPAGTWIITQNHPDWEVTYPNDGFYEVTVPSPTALVEDDENLFASLMSFVIPTAHAAIASNNGPLNFGNVFVGNTIVTTSSNGGNGRISMRSGGRVLGDSTSTVDDKPTPTVLGDATSTMPVGAPNTGAGGAAPVSSVLHMGFAILATRSSIKNGK